MADSPHRNPLVQEALEVTWTLKGYLKTAQMSYLRAGRLLARVRDRKMWEVLHNTDLGDYALKRLGLQQASLYRYLQVYDWAAASHPEWLEPHPKGFIPDLAAATALIWIEGRLAQKDLDPRMRAALEELLKKALAGQLTQKEFSEFRGHGREKKDSLRLFLMALRKLRQRGGKIQGMPAEVLSSLDAAIAALAPRVVRRQAIRHLRPWLTTKNIRRKSGAG